MEETNVNTVDDLDKELFKQSEITTQQFSSPTQLSLKLPSSPLPSSPQPHFSPQQPSSPSPSSSQPNVSPQQPSSPLPSSPQPRLNPQQPSSPLPSSPQPRISPQQPSSPLPSSPERRFSPKKSSSPLTSSPQLRLNPQQPSSPLPLSPQPRISPQQPSSPLPSSPERRFSPKKSSSPLTSSPQLRLNPQQPSSPLPSNPDERFNRKRASDPTERNPDARFTRKLASSKSSKTSCIRGCKVIESGFDRIVDVVSSLEPQGKKISDRVEQLTYTVNNLAMGVNEANTAGLTSNINKIATVSKSLSNEAKALRDSIKGLCEDISRTQGELCECDDKDELDINFPYHLFLTEIIINKIHMKCECFKIDFNNLVISATFLGKQPIVLYDTSFGKIENFSKLNVGKSTLFAMTYDKICSIEDFEIRLLLTKQPPCSSCVTKIAETRMDYTKEFIELREELCKKWTEEQPSDNILCTTCTPLSKNLYYLTCIDNNHDNRESIGVIEVTVRMSFLGKEITTAFCATPKPQNNGFVMKEDAGMAMYSCQKVEMDDQGKILLDEDVLSKSCTPQPTHNPTSLPGNALTKWSRDAPTNLCDRGPSSRYDEIYTKMNENELKIRVPKSTKVERMGNSDRVQELCECDSNVYNSGDQIQFELPTDYPYPEKTYTSNMRYTLKGIDRPISRKDKKIINVTPTDCPVPVNMSKIIDPLKDVFILKIGKKLETKDKKTDLEIELVTPKAPFAKPNVNDNGQQYSHGEGKSKKSASKNVKKNGKKKNKNVLPRGKRSKSKIPKSKTEKKKKKT